MDRTLRKLKTKAGKKTSSKRKESVEAIMGQMKQARGIGAFLLRGLQKVKAEWNLICVTHVILKLWHQLLADNGIEREVCALMDRTGKTPPHYARSPLNSPNLPYSYTSPTKEYLLLPQTAKIWRQTRLDAARYAAGSSLEPHMCGLAVEAIVGPPPSAGCFI